MKFKKNATLFFLSFIILTVTLFAQGVSINITGTKSDSSAMLDINHSNKGLLIPRVGLQNVNDALTIRKPAHSLLAFNINPSFMGGEGYYYNNGTPQSPIWIKLTTSNDNSNTNSWLASGNANLTDLAFLGTTDDANLIFKRNNEEVAQFYPGVTVVYTGNG